MGLKIWMPCTDGLRVKVRVDMESHWGPNGELPVHQCSYAEGDLKWYGSGTAVAELRELPIVVRMPFLVARGRILWRKGIAAVREATMALRKITGAAAGQAGGGPGITDKDQWPCLLEYLTETKYPDGSPREPSCLVVVADPTGWRGCVSDKDNARTLWKTADSVESLLNALEAALGDEDPSHWRQASASKWKGKKRG